MMRQVMVSTLATSSLLLFVLWAGISLVGSDPFWLNRLNHEAEQFAAYAVLVFAFLVGLMVGLCQRDDK